MKRRSMICITVFLCVAMLAGCSMGKSMEATDRAYSNDNGGYYPSETADFKMDFGYDEAEFYFEEAPKSANYSKSALNEYKSTGSNSFDTASSEAELTAAATGRKLIKTVNLSMQTLTFDEAIKEIEARTAALGGYIQSSGVSNNNYLYNDYRGSYRSLRYANYTVRIPSQWLDSFTNAMGNIGTVTNKSMGTEDVTLQYVDTESRAESLKLQRDRLMALLEKADKIEDIIVLEERLSDVIYQLERKESTLKNYDNLVEYSTVYINMEEVERITYEEPVQTFGSRISSGISETFYEISEGFKNFIVWFVTNLPFIVIWAVIIVAVVIVIKKLVVREKRKYSMRKAFNRAGSDDIVENKD